MAKLQDVIPRLYQETILNTCARYNTLVILPTGLGKTAVAMLLSVHRLNTYPQSKVLFLAPTKPLAEQHATTLRKHVSIKEGENGHGITLFTGDVEPEKRKRQWEESTLIVSTPQSIENDVINGRINLADVSLLIVDEAHRAVGNYSYSFIANQYAKKAKHTRILGLTASPGSQVEKILEVCTNLHVEEIEIRTERDPDVAPYVQKTDVKYLEVDLPEEFAAALKYLKDCFQSKLSEAAKYGYVTARNSNDIAKRDLLGMLASLQGRAREGERDFDVFKSISLLSEALKVEHAIELLETQGVQSAFQYMDGMEKESHTSTVKSLQNLVRDINFRSALIKTRIMQEKGIVHPKIPTILGLVDEVLEKNPAAKIIIFTNFRDTGTLLTQKLSLVKNANVRQFVGQAKKKSTGLSQKEQKAILDSFRKGDFNVLVATSVAEEGLDIPQVNNVIFYEPVASSIRSIQRRGRTGRFDDGEVVVLVTKKTRDVAYRWSSFHKEKRMYRILEDLRGKLKLHLKKPEKQTALPAPTNEIPKESIHIFIDDREKSSLIVKELIDMGIMVHLERLDVGDYLLSSRTGVEFKTISDFVDSIIDGRLLEQMAALKRVYEKPLLVLEGTEDIYSARNIHPNAIRGMLSMITVTYGIPILYTKNPKDTAGLLAIIAKREQTEDPRPYLPKAAEKKPSTITEQQQFIVASFPGIGATLAEPLLRQFKSVKDLVNATEKDLQQVDLIGPKKAEEIRKVLDAEYDKRQ